MNYAYDYDYVMDEAAAPKKGGIAAGVANTVSGLVGAAGLFDGGAGRSTSAPALRPAAPKAAAPKAAAPKAGNIATGVANSVSGLASVGAGLLDGGAGLAKNLHKNIRKTGSWRKKLVFVFSLVIWCISITSVVYCNKVMKASADQKKDTTGKTCNVSGEDLQKLYQYSITTLVLTSILLTILILKNIGETGGSFSVIEHTDEDRFKLIFAIIACIIFGIFAGFWGKASVHGCLKDGEKNSMVGITAAACAISGLIAIFGIIGKFGVEGIVGTKPINF